MKKILFAIALIFVLGLGANAQRDGFFTTNDIYNRDNNDGLGLPSTHNTNADQNSAPLGTGLLILTALGAGYAVARKKK
ncbi:MAG: hypothetical protein IIU33_05500 [Bacteroidales bacterium]|nr:hypothetical protein [Bacteroidales bacterium]MBQ5424663.1 hypothetical protein [Bacteroidales bacterium]